MALAAITSGTIVEEAAACVPLVPTFAPPIVCAGIVVLTTALITKFFIVLQKHSRMMRPGAAVPGELAAAVDARRLYKIAVENAVGSSVAMCATMITSIVYLAIDVFVDRVTPWSSFGHLCVVLGLLWQCVPL
ncbi:Uncharacterized protein PBTT_01837 [Plasmodiophora brassicae]